MLRVKDADAIVSAIVERTAGDIRLALPLGLGKPVTLVNALVQRACDDRDIRLTIFTALTLERPEMASDVQRRFLEPAIDRLFGAYPEVLYARLLRDGALPPNIRVNEFFLMAGRWLGVNVVQQSYISANYTHARDVLVAQNPNVLMQLVAEQDGQFSLSSNTDISTDLFRMRNQGSLDFTAVFETNPQMPFMGGNDAILGSDDVEMVLDPPAPFALFSAPRRPLSEADHAMGLHVARLVPDGGTLQIGIGALGDTVAHALLLRNRGDAHAVQRDCPFPVDHEPGGRFEAGLYAVTEMLVNGVLALFEEGVIRREVDGIAIHAGFFVETRDFYARLREMDADKRAKIAMMPVSFTNALYGNEAEKRAARTGARFINGAMQVSALGDVMSDSLEDGKVVSGVGGQFNFVEQAFALDGARAIIALSATRMSGGKLQSNIRWEVPTTTVPRHMRDIVVTEYGIADLRGRSDADVIAALLRITDSRFQNDLMARAKKAGKLPQDHEIAHGHRRNLPETISRWLQPHRADLREFPFGSDFDEIERVLLPALTELKDLSPTLTGKARLLLASVTGPAHPQEEEAMKRMGYASDNSLTARALRGALRRVVV
jgi:acyl-CoA hydrolase